VRQILVDAHAIDGSADLLRRLYGDRPSLWVLSDENTEAAAAGRWKSAIRASRITSRVLPGDPRPVPTLELADALSSEVKAVSPDLLVSVGSGVISDLVKKVSLDTGVPNWCVATAPSVDAYSSATSAIRVAGYHQPVPAGISETIVCDLEVMSRAPHPLFLAGLGDLLAKFIANLDWNLARMVTGEHFCETMAGFALGSARKAIQAARERESHPLEAARSLTDAVLVSGLAMQALGGSRPAASAEHTIAHHWEAGDAVGSKRLGLHGILVGAASRLVLRGYSECYRHLADAELDVGRRLASYEKEIPWDQRLEEGLLPFREKIAREMRGRNFDRVVLARRLDSFLREKERIVAVAEPLLAELSEAVRLLEGLGFPFSLGELGIAEPCRMLPVRNLRLLRNRYTTFDLAYELGREEELVGTIAACI
jgi:glycerol-1-phosphate dehydrogenase [NAD(P)+]